MNPYPRVRGTRSERHGELEGCGSSDRHLVHRYVRLRASPPGAGVRSARSS